MGEQQTPKSYALEAAILAAGAVLTAGIFVIGADGSVREIVPDPIEAPELVAAGDPDCSLVGLDAVANPLPQKDPAWAWQINGRQVTQASAEAAVVTALAARVPRAGGRLTRVLVLPHEQPGACARIVVEDVAP